MSSTPKLSLKHIKESYLLNANDVKKLSKPYRLDDVVNLAIEKFGSKAQLDAAIAKRDDERERKKNKKILKEQTAQKNRLLAEETLRKRLKLHGEEQKQNGKILKDENLTWLIHTTTGQQCVDKLVASGAPEDATKIDNETLSTLIVLNQKANERHDSITHAIKQRLIQRERQKLDEKWVEYDVAILVPPGSRLGIGALLGPMMSPPGLLVKRFLTPPQNMSQGRGNTITADKSVGPLEGSTPTGNSRIKNVLPGDIIVAINNNQILQNTIPMALMTLTMISQMSMMNSKKAQSVHLKMMRFQPASKELVSKAQQVALEPKRLGLLLSSPFILQYSQAIQPRKGEELTYWLLNQNAVISEIFAPFDRKQLLEELFLKHKLTLEGPHGLLQKKFDENNVKQMYDMYTIASILKKFMDAGEVGRGRNKTSLKTAKQVVTAVVTHMKTCNVYEECQQADIGVQSSNKKRKRVN